MQEASRAVGLLQPADLAYVGNTDRQLKPAVRPHISEMSKLSSSLKLYSKSWASGSGCLKRSIWRDQCSVTMHRDRKVRFLY